MFPIEYAIYFYTVTHIKPFQYFNLPALGGSDGEVEGELETDCEADEDGELEADSLGDGEELGEELLLDEGLSDGEVD